MLAKQGEELKAVAKLIDGYSERVTQVRGKLGDNETLAAVRNNLSKFKDQLTESRTILSIAGGLLTDTVEKYTAVETKQVKKVDSYKAHNRDFYKNPVVVASAGGAAGGAAVTAAASAPVQTASAPVQTVQTASAPVQAASAPAQTTVNYTENTTVNNITQVNVVNETVSSAASSIPASDMGAAVPMTDTVASATAAPVAPAAVPMTDSVAPVAAAAAGLGGGAVAGIAAGAGLAGAALGAGSIAGLKHLSDKKKANDELQKSAEAEEEYDPEKELAAALERVRLLSEED
jgi:hypothetical protein